MQFSVTFFKALSKMKLPMC